jgi:type I restriction system adenine methylase HsdM
MPKSKTTQRISDSELQTFLWGSAVLLRGLIDAGDYKGYIFPLIFLKRISDVWDEEHEIALEKYSNDKTLAELPENHRFVIPKDSHWNDIRNTTTNVGLKIVSCMRAIESKNSEALTGVFGDADWTNRDLLSDEVLSNLVEHFSSQLMTITRLPEDELGNGYEFLIKKFADDSGHTAQEFYTNRTLVHLMTKMLEPQPGESVYDPTCGTGGMLISCAVELKNQGKEFRSLKLYGQEMNYTTGSIAKMNLFLHGIEDGRIAQGDTLAQPRFLDSKGQLQNFDIVLANPPYSIKTLDRNLFASDPFGRNIWGIPPQGRADFAFFQHIAKSMNPNTGRAAILFPHGILFRKEEKDLRQKLIQSGILEAVIGLGAGLFYNSPMEAVVIILRNHRPSLQARQILFINAIDLVQRDRGISFLSNSDQDQILSAYKSFADQEGLSCVVDVKKIEMNDWSLAIPYYVDKVDAARNAANETFGELLLNWAKSSNSSDHDLDQVIMTYSKEMTKNVEN